MWVNMVWKEHRTICKVPRTTTTVKQQNILQGRFHSSITCNLPRTFYSTLTGLDWTHPVGFSIDCSWESFIWNCYIRFLFLWRTRCVLLLQSTVLFPRTVRNQVYYKTKEFQPPVLKICFWTTNLKYAWHGLLSGLVDILVSIQVWTQVLVVYDGN